MTDEEFLERWTAQAVSAKLRGEEQVKITLDEKSRLFELAWPDHRHVWRQCTVRTDSLIKAINIIAARAKDAGLPLSPNQKDENARI